MYDRGGAGEYQVGVRVGVCHVGVVCAAFVQGRLSPALYFLSESTPVPTVCPLSLCVFLSLDNGFIPESLLEDVMKALDLVSETE
jgi:hypothetical protein